MNISGIDIDTFIKQGVDYMFAILRTLRFLHQRRTARSSHYQGIRPVLFGLNIGIGSPRQQKRDQVSIYTACSDHQGSFPLKIDSVDIYSMMEQPADHREISLACGV